MFNPNGGKHLCKLRCKLKEKDYKDNSDYQIRKI